MNDLMPDRYWEGLPLYSAVEIDSTNLWARREAVSLNGEAIFIAERQTAGRGRRGRSFLSPEGGLYLSLLLRPDFSPEDYLWITTAAACAATAALEDTCGVFPGIKWVNDLWLEGKKICGILTEGIVLPDGGFAAILGIGINLLEPAEGFPLELRNIAGAVFTDRKKADDCRKILLRSLLNHFFALYVGLDKNSIVDFYRRRLLFLGEDIIVHRGESYRTGKLLACDDKLRLLVRYDDTGENELLSSGEISIRPR